LVRIQLAMLAVCVLLGACASGTPAERLARAMNETTRLAKVGTTEIKQNYDRRQNLTKAQAVQIMRPVLQSQASLRPVEEQIQNGTARDVARVFAAIDETGYVIDNFISPRGLVTVSPANPLYVVPGPGISTFLQKSISTRISFANIYGIRVRVFNGDMTRGIIEFFDSRGYYIFTDDISVVPDRADVDLDQALSALLVLCLNVT
jgi:hypothetical protein